MRRRAPRRRGQAMVEFAFVFPFLIAVLLGIFDVARLMFVRVSLDSGTAAAARLVAANHPGTTKGSVYKTLTRAAPGVAIRPQYVTTRRVEGPRGEPWVEVRAVVHSEMISLSYVSEAADIRIVSTAAAPVDVRATGGEVHLP